MEDPHRREVGSELQESWDRRTERLSRFLGGRQRLWIRLRRGLRRTEIVVFLTGDGIGAGAKATWPSSSKVLHDDWNCLKEDMLRERSAAWSGAERRIGSRVRYYANGVGARRRGTNTMRYSQPPKQQIHDNASMHGSDGPKSSQDWEPE